MTAFLSQTTTSNKFNSSFGNKKLGKCVSCTFEAVKLKIIKTVCDEREINRSFASEPWVFFPEAAPCFAYQTGLSRLMGEGLPFLLNSLETVQTLFHKLRFLIKICCSDLFSPCKCLTISMWFLSQGLTHFAGLVSVCRSSLRHWIDAASSMDVSDNRWKLSPNENPTPLVQPPSASQLLASSLDENNI